MDAVEGLGLWCAQFRELALLGPGVVEAVDFAGEDFHDAFRCECGEDGRRQAALFKQMLSRNFGRQLLLLTLVEVVEQGDEHHLLLLCPLDCIENLVHRLVVVAVDGQSDQRFLLRAVTLNQLFGYYKHATLYHRRYGRFNRVESCLLAYLGGRHLSVMVERLHYYRFAVGHSGVGHLLVVGIQLDECFALDLKSGRDSSLVDIAGSAKVVFGNPFPQFQLRMLHHRPRVENRRYVLDLESLGSHRRYRLDDSGVVLLTPERHDDTMSHCGFPLQCRGDAVGEGSEERQRQYHLGI